MKKIALTAALLAALPLTTTAANNYYMKIGDIKGESQDSKHKEEIEILSWSWGASNSGSAVGGGGGASRVSFQDFSWQQMLDSSFVPLFLGVANGTHFKDAELTVVRAGKEQQEFFKMAFGDAQIVSLSSSGGSDSIIVNAAMSYQSITMTYSPQKADGSLGNAVVGKWDLKNNKAAFSGDPLVVLGLAEAGGALNFEMARAVPEPATWASLISGLAVLGWVARRRKPQPGAEQEATG